MAIKKILVAVDGSDGADRALGMAQAIAAPSAETHVDLVYVVPIPLLDDNQAANFKSILDMMVADGRDLLAEAREKVPRDCRPHRYADHHRHESGYGDHQAHRKGRIRLDGNWEPRSKRYQGLSWQRKPQGFERLQRLGAYRQVAVLSVADRRTD